MVLNPVAAEQGWIETAGQAFAQRLAQRAATQDLAPLHYLAEGVSSNGESATLSSNKINQGR